MYAKQHFCVLSQIKSCETTVAKTKVNFLGGPRSNNVRHLMFLKVHTENIIMAISRRGELRGGGAKSQIILHLRQSHILPFIFSSPHPTKSKALLWRENGWLLLLH